MWLCMHIIADSFPSNVLFQAFAQLCKATFHEDLVLDLGIAHDNDDSTQRSNACIPDDSSSSSGGRHVKHLWSNILENVAYVVKVSRCFRELETFSVQMNESLFSALSLVHREGGHWVQTPSLFPNLYSLCIELVDSDVLRWTHTMAHRHFPRLVELEIGFSSFVSDRFDISSIPHTVRYLTVDWELTLSGAIVFYERVVELLPNVRMLRCFVKPTYSALDHKTRMVTNVELRKIRELTSPERRRSFRERNTVLPDLVVSNAPYCDWFGNSTCDSLPEILRLDGVWINGMFAPDFRECGSHCAMLYANSKWDKLAEKYCTVPFSN